MKSFLKASSPFILLNASLLLILPSPVKSQNLLITGRVIDSLNREPIVGATVKWQDGARTTTTNSQGLFTLFGSTTSLAPDATSPLDFSTPYLSAGRLRFATKKSPQTVVVSMYNSLGETLSTQQLNYARQGWQDLPIIPEGKEFFLGFISLQTEAEAFRFRIMHNDSPISVTKAEYLPPIQKVSARSQNGKVFVSMAGLNPGTVEVSSDTMNMGDIVLGYPARQNIGIGAVTPFGAAMLFDGSQGRVAANNELQTKWMDWPRFSNPSPIKFRLVRDPEFLKDTNRVTLQSCCNTLWGYDDIQAKVGIFQDAQIHVEFIGMGEYDSPSYDTLNPNANATNPSGNGQPGYINSGVYVASKYEVQIQSWNTDAKSIPSNHDMGALVDQFSPTLNQNKANGVWQAYDITFRGARYSGSTMTTPPYITVWWNGILVHKNLTLGVGASGLANHSGEEHDDPILYGLKLQSEGRDVRYRNLWVKKLTLPTPQTQLGF